MNSTPPQTPRALLLNGVVGAGKTTVASAVGELLTEAGVPHAVLDLDAFRHAWPPPPGDPFHSALGMRNLRAVARNCLEAGAVRLVLAGVVEDRADRRRHHEAVGVGLTVCLLRTALPVVRQRLTARHQGQDGLLRWYLDRAGELEEILRAARVEDFTVDATEGSPRDVAGAVLSATGWGMPGPPP